MKMRSLTSRSIAASTHCPLKIRLRPSPTAVHAATYNNEAENLYKGIPLSEGLINKRLAEKQMSKENKEFVSAMKLAEDESEKELLLRRETRTAPTNNEEIVDYFLNTMSEDMEFEVSRYRPMLDEGFFRHLDTLVGALRFSTGEDQDEDGLAELEGLRDYLTQAVKLVDQAVTKVSSAKDKVTRLLSSRDKKELILQMAENNEIDHAFMIALDSNIKAARLAGQEEPAKFMEKVRDACAKFYVPPVSTMPPPLLPSSQATIDVQAQEQSITPQAIADIAAKSAREASRKAANGLIIPGSPGALSSQPGPVPVKRGGAAGGGGASPSGLIIPGR